MDICEGSGLKPSARALADIGTCPICGTQQRLDRGEVITKHPAGISLYALPSEVVLQPVVKSIMGLAAAYARRHNQRDLGVALMFMAFFKVGRSELVANLWHRVGGAGAFEREIVLLIPRRADEYTGQLHLTGKARTALEAAQEFAAERGNSEIDETDFYWGLLSLDQGAAVASLLNNFGITLDEACEYLFQVTGIRPERLAPTKQA